MSWRSIGVGAAIASFCLLTAEHLIGHGRDLGPIDHWLSEYVLSDSLAAAWIMRLAFVALALCAVAVSRIALDRPSRVLFTIASLGLAAMTFFDTDPNDGRSYAIHWPLTTGNLHQLLLYAAIGATLLGMAWQLGRGPRLKGAVGLLSIAVSSTIVQLVLVIESQRSHTMTHFGGLTERIVVISALVWVICFCRATTQ